MKWLSWLKNSVGMGRDRLKDKLVSSDPGANYRQPGFYTGNIANSLVNQLPPFFLSTGRLMLKSDPIVQFSQNVRNAALATLEVEIEAKSPAVKAWVQKQWDTCWGQNKHKLIMSKRWGFQPLQVSYKYGPDGMLHIDSLRDFAPEDCRASLISGRVCGFKLKGERMLNPQALWITFNAEYGSPYGTGTLSRSYPPWYEKWMQQGSKKLGQLRMIKDAWMGDVFWYPPNMLAKLPDGTQLPWRDVMREIGENRVSGSSMTLPMMLDSNGKRLTEYQPPQGIAGGEHIWNWEDRNNEDILRGADVPIEVVKAQENGGFSGRSIPFMVVLSCCTMEASEIVQCLDEQVLRTVAWLNYGSDPEYTIKAKSLVESFAKDAGGSPMGGGAIGGQPGQSPKPAEPPAQQQPKMGWVGSDGKVTQFHEDDPDGKWVTIGGRKSGDEEHKGGFPVQIDANGNILKSGGPQSLVGKHVSNVTDHLWQERTEESRKSNAAKNLESELETKVGARGSWQQTVKANAAARKMDPETYEQIAGDVWKETLAQHADREAAKEYARKLTGLHAGDIERLENQGLDYASAHKRIKGFDIWAEQVASQYPGILTSGEPEQELWDLIKEGTKPLPSKNSPEFAAAVEDYLGPIGRKKKPVKENDDFDFGANSQFDELDPLPSPSADIAFIGAASARRRIADTTNRIKSILSKGDLSRPGTLIGEIEKALIDLRLFLVTELSASMLGGQFTGMADVLGEINFPLPLPTAAPAEVIPPAKPPKPPALQDFFGDDEPEPKAVFPVVEDALEKLHESPVFVGRDFTETAAAVKEGAFAITGEITDKAASEIRDLLAKHLEEGPNVATFTEQVTKLLDEGTLSENHIQTVFRTNVNSAISDGKNRALSQPMVADAFPYRQYWSTTDQRARKEHRALETRGLNSTNIYRADDPVWLMFRPPWAFGCRCRWNPVTVEQAARAGVQEAKDWWQRAKDMAAANGGSPYQYLSQTAPSEPAWVQKPEFQPDPTFQREPVQFAEVEREVVNDKQFLEITTALATIGQRLQSIEEKPVQFAEPPAKQSPPFGINIQFPEKFTVENVLPEVIVNVPQQPAPVVNVTTPEVVVNWPEQTASVIPQNLEANVPEPEAFDLVVERNAEREIVKIKRVPKQE